MKVNNSHKNYSLITVKKELSKEAASQSPIHVPSQAPGQVAKLNPSRFHCVFESKSLVSKLFTKIMDIVKKAFGLETSQMKKERICNSARSLCESSLKDIQQLQKRHEASSVDTSHKRSIEEQRKPLTSPHSL